MKNIWEHFEKVKSTLRISGFRSGPAAASLAALLAVILVVAGNMNRGGVLEDMGEFEEGKVAEQDVVAHEDVSYVDEEATALRREAQARLVPAVFRFSGDADGRILGDWNRFAVFSNGLAEGGLSAEAAKRSVQAEYPGYFSWEALDAWFASPVPFAEYGGTVLAALVKQGIFALSDLDLEPYNPDVAELLSTNGSRTEKELVSYGDVITLKTAGEAVRSHASGGGFPPSFAAVAADMLLPFIKENVFFSSGDTRQRVAETLVRVEPVLKHIERGRRVIRKGFVVTGEDMRELRALGMTRPERDPRGIAGRVLILLLLYVFLVFFCRQKIAGRSLSDREIYLVAAVVSLYFMTAVFAGRLSLDSLPVSMVLPTALAVMLPAILVTPQLALFLAMILPLGVFLTGSFDMSSYVFALVSAVAASYALKGAQKRMDLVRAGVIIALANITAAAIIILSRRSGPASWPPLLFWAGFNGLASGMLVLGFLPPLEQALNAATSFRLMELSDLNAPILKRLFTTAPGTHGHSIMVANLAEAACQDIGANPLLARVGAYYHDIGKMEQPEYFVENQTVYNKHDDTPPRLSATVIRSHVKLGVEKARSLGLPRQVIDIIAEHHGNSVISWFYNKALKQEIQVNMEDFTYPGNPPRSRESAVVMLADVTEAAVRTLNKPTVGRMEKFIQELFTAKVEHGQLAESELTFRDLEMIKNAFVRVLAGHYHSRIEYPKQAKEAPLREVLSKEALRNGEGLS
ncbi:MAG: HDIG domain-containing protein [Treponema sp.]|nr:HDIG domain-containing protein [Treponema sp.]